MRETIINNETASFVIDLDQTLVYGLICYDVVLQKSKTQFENRKKHINFKLFKISF
jgi:hypothetical protein